MNEDFAEFFLNFCEANDVYLCTGSDWEKVKEQVPKDVIKASCGVFVCSGNAFWSNNGRERTKCRAEFTPPKELIDDLKLFLDSSDCPTKAGNHIEYRIGMINYSTVGRDCSQEQRKEYSEWDAIAGEREKIVSVLRRRYEDLAFNIGGQISIDIHPSGFDKSRAVEFIREWCANEEISLHFFGDRLQPGGNDYPVLKALTERDNYDKVEDYEHTWKLLKSLDQDEASSSPDSEELKPKPSSKLAPRGIETFTICRQADETGISGTGVVIEGVEYATGQVVLHWLTPFPKGSIAIFESMVDFKRVHVNPHPDNKTIITYADGRQEEF
jgi:phosphomannomutase